MNFSFRMSIEHHWFLASLFVVLLAPVSQSFYLLLLNPMLHRTATFLALPLFAFTVIGCSGGPSRVEQPRINASRAGSDALELYDTDGDGVIAGKELDASPPLKNELALIDTDGDGGISADEIAARVDAWKAQKTGLLSLRGIVNLDGKPKEGLLVIYEPEPFVADYLSSGRGNTNRFGMFVVSVPKEDRPSADTPSGMPMGFYRVRVTSTAGKSLPARYNTETTLGLEVSYDNKYVLNMAVAHDLKSK